jgi:hypothetical protein
VTGTGKRACTLILPAAVYDRVRAISTRTKVPANAITALALEHWLQRFDAGDRLAQAFADEQVLYDDSGTRADLPRVRRRASTSAGDATE